MPVQPERNKSVLYVVKANRFYKIGISLDFAGRLADIQLYNPLKVRLVTFEYIPTRRRIQIEKAVHARLADYRMHGEWFDASPVLIKQVVREVVTSAKKQEPWHLAHGHCDKSALRDYT
jgi:hypothetical protein